MNLCGDALWHLVVLQGQTNLVLVLRVEQVHIKCQRLAIEDVQFEVDERFKDLRAHTAANRVVSLDFREALAAHKEMTTYH